MAGGAPFPVGDSLGRRHGRPPKVVLSLIGCFCHKEFFSRPLFGSQANYQSKLLQRRHLRAGQGGGRPLRRARITLSKPEFSILHDLAGLRTYPVWFLAAVSSQLSALSK